MLDSSALLRLYRYSAGTLKDVKAAVDSFRPNVFLPHQIGLEFHRNRYRAISQQYDTFDKFLRDYHSKRDELLKGIRDHHFLDEKKYKLEFEKLEAKIKKDVERKRKQYPNYFKSDTILKWVTKTFGKAIGDKYPPEILLEKIREAEVRYLAEIPPGFRDSETKKDTRQFGDYILWCQILDHARTLKSPVVLVIDDVKTDWWTISNPGKKENRLPHPYLLQEVWDVAKQRIVICTSDEFLREVSKRKKAEVSSESVREAADIRYASAYPYATQISQILSSVSKNVEQVTAFIANSEWQKQEAALRSLISAIMPTILAAQKRTELNTASLAGITTNFLSRGSTESDEEETENPD